MNLYGFRQTGNNAVFHYEGINVPKKQVLEAMQKADSPATLATKLESIVYNILQLRRGRKTSREVRVVTRGINNRFNPWLAPSVQLVGGVHIKENTILDIYTQRQSTAWENGKKPLTDEFHYGIEIELTTNSNKFELIRHALALNLKNYLQIKRDGSIRTMNMTEAFELCICVPESQLVEVMQRVQTLLTNIDAVVNKSCGLHIHLDMRQTNDDREKQWEAYLNLKMGQNIIKRSVSKERHASRWCRWTTATDIMSARNASTRYRAINGNALRSHGTIEVRAFQATTDCTDIVTYCLMLKKILNTKNPLKRASNSQATLARIYGHDVVRMMRTLEEKYNMAS